jgi:O-antigen/teichoic acid export membrane protein
MPEKSLKKSAAYNLARTVSQLLFPLITFPYASRILLPEGIGKVNFANSIVAYFSMLAGLGIGGHGIRACAKVRDNRAELSQTVGELFTINLEAAAAAYLLFIAAVFFVPKLEDYRRILCVCSGTIAFAVIGFDWLYSALEEYRYITIRSILFQIISLILLFIFVKTRDDYIKYAGIGVFASAGSNILNHIRSRKFIDLRLKPGREQKKHLKPVFMLFSMVLASSVYTLLDTTMLGFMANDTEVGMYTAAIKINRMVLSMIIAASVVLMPRLSYYIAQHDTNSFSNLIHRGLNFVIFFAVPAAIGLYLLSAQIIFLFSGINYQPAIPVMRIMSPIILMIGVSNLIGIQFFIPLGKEKATLISVALGAVINFSLNMALIPSHGALGAGIATLCAETMITVLQFILVYRSLRLKEIGMNCVQVFVAALCMSAVVVGILHFTAVMVLQIVLSVTIGSVVYGGVLVLLKNNTVLLLTGSLKPKCNEI